MKELSFYAVVAFALVATAYGVGRAFSIAYFRTKLEYWRSIIREGGAGKHNGQE